MHPGVLEIGEAKGNAEILLSNGPVEQWTAILALSIVPISNARLLQGATRLNNRSIEH
jgi:hypothetical protein